MNRTWLKIQSKIHQFVYRISDGKIGSYFGAPTLLLTTTGRKSGQSRTTPLYYVEDANQWAVVASNAGSEHHPAWFLNLQAMPSAKIQIREKQFDVQFRVANKEERDRLWSQFVDIFAGYQTYQNETEREMPIVILAPDK